MNEPSLSKFWTETDFRIKSMELALRFQGKLLGMEELLVLAEKIYKFIQPKEQT
jgi:hypothetical protein